MTKSNEFHKRPKKQVLHQYQQKLIEKNTSLEKRLHGSQMNVFKRERQEHTTMQARGAEHMEFVNEIALVCGPIRVEKLMKLNDELSAQGAKRLTFKDIMNTTYEEPVEKCIREYCEAANKIFKSHKSSQNLPVHTTDTLKALENLQSEFFDKMRALQPNTNSTKYHKDIHGAVAHLVDKHIKQRSAALPYIDPIDAPSHDSKPLAKVRAPIPRTPKSTRGS